MRVSWITIFLNYFPFLKIKNKKNKKFWKLFSFQKQKEQEKWKKICLDSWSKKPLKYIFNK